MSLRDVLVITLCVTSLVAAGALTVSMLVEHSAPPPKIIYIHFPETKP